MDIITLHNAFKMAIEKENEVANFYGDLASQVTDNELKKLFEALSAEERRHFNRLAEAYKTMKEKITG